GHPDVVARALFSEGYSSSENSHHHDVAQQHRDCSGSHGYSRGLSTPPRAGRLPVGRSGPESRSPLGSASSEKWKEGFLMRKDSRGCELFLAVRSHQFGAFSSEPS